MTLRVGVLAVQGAVSEHDAALRAAGQAAGIDVDVVKVRSAADLASVSGIVLPGGESTTMSRLLRAGGLQEELVRRADDDLAVFGTCAGMILLASGGDHDLTEKGVEPLALLDADVDRNAFGRQRESFETTLDVDGVGAMPAVFIRAPAYDRLGGDVHALARFDGRIVAAERGSILATAFHPELTGDTRLHQRFLRAAAARARGGPLLDAA